MQWAWYVEDGIKDVIADNVVLVDGDVELGKGVALVWTPGHTDGNHSLVRQHRRRRLGLLGERRRRRLLAPAPLEDPGRPQDRRVLRPRGDPELEHARGLDRPVRLDGQGEGARRPEPRDPRCLNVFPSSEMASWKRQWPVVPTFVYGGINTGVIERSGVSKRRLTGR